MRFLNERQIHDKNLLTFHMTLSTVVPIIHELMIDMQCQAFPRKVPVENKPNGEPVHAAIQYLKNITERAIHHVCVCDASNASTMYDSRKTEVALHRGLDTLERLLVTSGRGRLDNLVFAAGQDILFINFFDGELLRATLVLSGAPYCKK